MVAPLSESFIIHEEKDWIQKVVTPTLKVVNHALDADNDALAPLSKEAYPILSAVTKSAYFPENLTN